MLQQVRWIAATLTLAAGALVLSPSLAEEKDKAPPIKLIMKTANAGPKALLSQTAAGLKSADPKWDDLAKTTASLVKCVSYLEKNTPPKGNKESWEKMAGAYIAKAKALDEAVSKKEKGEAEGIVKQMQGSCSACHKLHKGK